MKSDDPLEHAARKRVHHMLRLVRFATIYLLVVIGLTLLHGLHPGGHFNPLYPIGGLTIALAAVALGTWWRLGASGLEARWIKHERELLARREGDLSH